MAVKKILFNGNENPATITYAGQDVKEVIFKNAPTASGEKVWGKYNLTVNVSFPDGVDSLNQVVVGDATAPAYGTTSYRPLGNGGSVWLGERISIHSQGAQGFKNPTSTDIPTEVTKDLTVNITVRGEPFTLTTNFGTGIQSIKATRTQLGKPAECENAQTGTLINCRVDDYPLKNTATVYYGDVIQITATTDPEYIFETQTSTINAVDKTITITGTPRVAQAPTLKWLTDTWNTGGTRITRPLLVSNPNNFSITIQFIIDILGGTIQTQAATIPASSSSTIIISVTALPDTDGVTTAQYRNSVVSTMQGSISISNAEKINYTMPSLSIPARSDNAITIYNPNNTSGTYDFMITCEDSASSVFVDEWTITGTVAATGYTYINVNSIIRDAVGSTLEATGPFRLEGIITIGGETFNYLEETEMDYFSS